MVELVDTLVSGTSGGNPVEVRVLFPAPLQNSISSIKHQNLLKIWRSRKQESASYEPAIAEGIKSSALGGAVAAEGISRSEAEGIRGVD